MRISAPTLYLFIYFEVKCGLCPCSLFCETPSFIRWTTLSRGGFCRTGGVKPIITKRIHLIALLLRPRMCLHECVRALERCVWCLEEETECEEHLDHSGLQSSGAFTHKHYQAWDQSRQCDLKPYLKILWHYVSFQKKLSLNSPSAPGAKSHRSDCVCTTKDNETSKERSLFSLVVLSLSVFLLCFSFSHTHRLWVSCLACEAHILCTVLLERGQTAAAIFSWIPNLSTEQRESWPMRVKNCSASLDWLTHCYTFTTEIETIVPNDYKVFILQQKYLYCLKTRYIYLRSKTVIIVK